VRVVTISECASHAVVAAGIGIRHDGPATIRLASLCRSNTRLRH
jgi:hypothetical protein